MAAETTPPPAPTPDDIIASQNLRIAALETKVATLLSLQGSVSTQPEPKKKPVLPTDPITIGKDKYKFKFAAFIFETVRYEAADAALDADLLKRIIAVNGQGILVKQF